MDEIKITNWDGKEFSLPELRSLVNESVEFEMPFDELIDGDEATPPSIIIGLLDVLEKLLDVK